MHGLTEERERLWDSAYKGGADDVSWYQADPTVSLELIDALDVSEDAAVIDVGGGASLFVERLLDRGFTDLSVLDISAVALAEARRRLRDDSRITWLHQDLLRWRPHRRFDLWHDRAVFHFLVDPEDCGTYLQTLHAALQPGGAVVLATFAPDGPEFCSGLPDARYSPADLCHLLGVGFEPARIRREAHTTPKGVVQPFTWVAGRIRETSGAT
ncbi:MAG: class I SAM-dependent methyltransferase [Acidimicrobiia bacterium]